MKSVINKRYIQVAILLIVVCLSYQNCSQNGQMKFSQTTSVDTSSKFADANGNGVDDSLETAGIQPEAGPNSGGPISEKNSSYKICSLSTPKEIYKFSDLVEFGGTVDLAGNRFLQYDIVDKSVPSTLAGYPMKRINEKLRDYVKRYFDRAGLKNADFIRMVPGEIYNESTGLFQPVSADNIETIRLALTMPEFDSGVQNLMPLPGYYFYYEVEGNQEKKIPFQQKLENFVGNIRFSHITSQIPGLFGHVVLYSSFLDVPQSLAIGAKNAGEALDTNKTLEIPSHKVCYLPQFDGSILERNIDSTVPGDKIRIWKEAEGYGSSNFGRRVERCFHDETKKCVSDNWLHRTNGFSDHIYNIEIN